MAERDLEREGIWRDALTNPASPIHVHGRIRRHLPGSPRCKLCMVPLAGVIAPILKISGLGPSSGNPRFCNACEVWATEHPGGADVELTVLFADIRGSTGMAENVDPAEFAQLMQRFYKVSSDVFIDKDAFIDSPVGDETRALFLPAWGSDHAAKAIGAAQNLLTRTGHADKGGPWVPVGVGVHTGMAYVGTVGVEGTNGYDITVLGDLPNVASRLASLARAGEIFVSESAYSSSGLNLGDLERRSLDIRGRVAPLDTRVLTVGADDPLHPGGN